VAAGLAVAQVGCLFVDETISDRRGHGGLAIRSGMLIDERGLGRRVPKAVHEFAHRRADLSSHGGAGVAEVVEAEIGATDLLAGALEDFVHAAVVHVLALGVG
jgi:hypothetical protein